MGNEQFFEESREQSIVKATIVEKYFDAWAQIISATQDRYSQSTDNKIGYVDLFAGPGRYNDGSISTPLRVLQRAIDDPKLAARLVTIFNDVNPSHSSNLRSAIEALPGLSKLRYPPKVWNEEVGSEIAKQFALINKIPILAFIDPWGYKGLTLHLVESFLKDWGCDCIFFFNYARINAGLSNPRVKQHMDALFGETRAEQLRRDLEPLSPAQRESTIVDALAQSLKAYGHRLVLPFCFKDERGTRTKHHLILVTKHFRGYEVMKDVMAKSSSSASQGVPSFTFSPADGQRQQLLFELNRPLEDLAGMLLERFAGRTLRMVEIYEQHSVDTPYISKNYKDVLTKLEKDKAVQTSGRRSSRGFADNILVTFPPRGK